MIGVLLTQAVEVLPLATGSATDAEGNVVTADGATRSYLGLLQRTRTTEVADGARVLERTGWTLFLPPAAEVGPHDRVRVDGRVFQVDGEPERVQTPRGVHHVEVLLVAVEG